MAEAAEPSPEREYSAAQGQLAQFHRGHRGRRFELANDRAQAILRAKGAGLGN